MGRPKYPKPDSNQRDFFEVLEPLGYVVDDVSKLAHLGFDLLVTGQHRRWMLPIPLMVEVKAPGGTLTKTEEERAAEMEYKFGDDAPYIVAYEPDDVLRWFGAL